MMLIFDRWMGARPEAINFIVEEEKIET